MEKDLVSIIIPVYNVAPYLDRCMKSILEQTYSHLEIILVDDGATDESGAMCDEYATKDSRVIVIHQENRGLSAARNVGTLASSGKYICFVDPDDEVDVQYVELLHAAMVSQNVSLAMCAYVSAYEKTNMRVFRYPYEETVDSKRVVFTISTDEYVKNYVERRKSSVTAWSRMYTSELANSVLFPEGKVYEDLATHVLYAIGAEKIAIVNRPLYKQHKQRGDSITATISTQNMQDYLEAYQTVYNQIITYDPQLADKAKWIVQEAPLSILLIIYLRQKSNAKVDNTFINNLRSDVRTYLFHGGYHDFCTWLKAVLVLTAPNMLPVLGKVRSMFRRKNKA